MKHYLAHGKGGIYVPGNNRPVPPLQVLASLDDLGHTLHAFELLARSNGRRETDRFELFAPPVIQNNVASFYFFTRGVRYLAREFQKKWETEDPIGPPQAKLEPCNKVDGFAVQLTSPDHFPMGYVPQYYSQTIFELLLSRQMAEFAVFRRNPPPAPTRERLLIKASLQVPQGWVFDDSQDFRSISLTNVAA